MFKSLIKFILNVFCSVLCSVLGAMVLVGGLYSVLWGKNREHKVEDGICLTSKTSAEIECSGSNSKEAIVEATKTVPVCIMV